jgi:hypothetical protein
MKINKELEKQVEDLKTAIEFSRQYYHLPQDVYDVFRGLVPETVELVETRNEIYHRLRNRKPENNHV